MLRNTQLLEKEVERHGLVRDEGMDAGGNKGLDRDGRRAVADDDSGVLGVIRLVNGGNGGG
jgi:hypothetical protein